MSHLKNNLLRKRGNGITGLKDGVQHLAQKGLVKGWGNLPDQLEYILDVSFLNGRSHAIPWEFAEAFHNDGTSEPVWSETSRLHLI
mmetsp:Transcript_629/g.847  ORF Transcript_629/g.847 Transcript_629/m.847 type:complete len:86 (-) Transcript_629:292-549(-)